MNVTPANESTSEQLESAAFEGTVRHRRFIPTQHEFEYPIHMFLLKAEEIPDLTQRFWQLGKQWYRWARFKREDYIGSTGEIAASVRSKIAKLAGQPVTQIEGDVFCLVHLRYFGFYFSPLNVYYLRQDGKYTYQLAEVSNTPWHERHYYLLDLNKLEPHAKEFHVSPFNPIQQSYHWRIQAPSDERCSVHIAVHDRNQSEQKVFDATLSLKRVELNQRELSRVLWKTPCQTLSLVSGIYWQALRLLWKRTPLYKHPKKHCNKTDSKTEEGTA